ncbi:hypothetical protein [Deinococcus saxicola]|uniref:hypothetical protein n=1 Tax=Deinococcus saxicola TaxID=249406 RepID=UPI003D0D5518
MKKRINAADYVVDSSHKFLIDANVWLYIAGPQANQNNFNTRNYSRLLRDLLSSKVEIFYTDLIVSEYINRVLRIYYGVYKDSNNDQSISFKEYRNTKDYINSMTQVKIGLDLIASIAQPVELDGWNVYLKGISSYMLNNPSDYNDIIISEISKIRGLILISNDGDMAMYDCKTLSFHRGLIN